MDTIIELFTSNAEIVYNFVTGGLANKPDGCVVGGGSKALIADLVGNPSIKASDFLIVA